MLVHKIHLVGIPPTEVKSLAELRRFSLWWRWSSRHIVDHWSNRLDCRRDLDIGMVDVYRDVCATSKPCARIICPVVGTTKGNRLWVIEVIHASE